MECVCVCVCVCACVRACARARALQHGAVGGEDPESSGPASEGCQRLLWPLREDLSTARQEEEIPDQGDSHSHDSLTQTVFTPRKENKKIPQTFHYQVRQFPAPHGGIITVSLM